MTYRFMTDHIPQWSVEKMARVLAVSSSGYYAWRRRSPSAKAKKDMAVVEQIRAIQRRHRRRYGSPRVWQELKSQGIVVGHNRGARLMRLNDLQCKSPKRFKRTTNSHHSEPVAENLLDRKCNGALVIDAFMMAVVRRRPTGGLLFHSDRGIQYCASAFRSVSEMAVPQLGRSMSRKGNCWDNACAESFFKTLKRELEELDGSYRRKKVRLAAFEYIEGYYNRLRIHTSIGFLPPVMVSSRVA